MSRQRHADPPLPLVLLDGPAALHLQPVPRRSLLVHAGLVLGQVALIPALDHLRSCLQTIEREPPNCEDQLTAEHARTLGQSGQEHPVGRGRDPRRRELAGKDQLAMMTGGRRRQENCASWSHGHARGATGDDGRPAGGAP